MASLAPGSTFGAYRIVEQLGRGGMATVWKAYEPSLDRYVALKVLPPEFLHDENFATRFQREARVVARLEHPHIVPIFAFGIEAGTPWMSTRLIAGGSLAGLLANGRVLPLQRAIEVLASVAEALTYAHREGVMHRDVKPQNVLLDANGRVYLADFGIARMVEGEASLTRTGLVSGTPQYMAPEYAAGEGLDHRVDIYALGILAYEMLTGAAPFTADTPVAVLFKQVSAPIPIPPREFVPEPLLGPLLRALAKDPKERFQSATDFSQALRNGEEQVRVATANLASDPTIVVPRPFHPVAAPATAATLVRPEAPVEPPVRKAAGWVGWVAGVGIVVVLGGTLMAAYLLRRPTPPVSSLSSESPESAAPRATPAPIASSAPPPPESSSRSVVPPPPTVEAVEAGPKPAPVPAAPVKKSAPRSPRPQRPQAVTEPAPSIPAAPPAPVVEPEPPPPPVGRAFRLDAPLDISSLSAGPVAFKSVQFQTLKNGELEARFTVHCAEGEDQLMSYQIEFFDDAGAAVTSVKGERDLDEGKDAKFRRKFKLPAGALSRIARYRVTATSQED